MNPCALVPISKPDTCIYGRGISKIYLLGCPAITPTTGVVFSTTEEVTGITVDPALPNNAAVLIDFKNKDKDDSFIGTKAEGSNTWTYNIFFRHDDASNDTRTAVKALQNCCCAVAWVVYTNGDIDFVGVNRNSAGEWVDATDELQLGEATHRSGTVSDEASRRGYDLNLIVKQECPAYVWTAGEGAIPA